MSKPVNINEFLELSPVMLKPYGIVGSQMIHSNEKIGENTKDWCSKSKITKDINAKISEGIDKKRIIPGYLDSSTVSFLFKKLLYKNRGTTTLGFYASNTKNIALVLDKNVTFFGKAMRELPPILVHELVHFVANIDTKLFLKYSLGPYIAPFYKEFFRSMLPNEYKKIDQKRLREFAIELTLISDGMESVFSLKNHAAILNSFLTTFLSKDRADEVTTNMIGSYAYFVMGKSKYRICAKRTLPHYFKAYDSLGVDGRITTPCQEAIYPSEIVAICNEFKPSRFTITMINNLKL